ncbi:hypothetical protein G6F22_014363 [Rhizopus arrhizus]|nr:hypothetical protein G6F22_014363 [Rhizopus arrhizus]
MTLPAGATSSTLRRASSNGDSLEVGSILMPSISKLARPRVGLAAEVEAVRIQCHGVLAAAEIERALPVASALVMGTAQGVGAVAGQQGAGVVGHGGRARLPRSIALHRIHRPGADQHQRHVVAVARLALQRGALIEMEDAEAPGHADQRAVDLRGVIAEVAADLAVAGLVQGIRLALPLAVAVEGDEVLAPFLLDAEVGGLARAGGETALQRVGGEGKPGITATGGEQQEGTGQQQAERAHGMSLRGGCG